MYHPGRWYYPRLESHVNVKRNYITGQRGLKVGLKSCLVRIIFYVDKQSTATTYRYQLILLIRTGTTVLQNITVVSISRPLTIDC